MSTDLQYTQACQRCWRRKQKCGRQRPTCEECLRAEARCVPRIWGRVPEGDADLIFNGDASARSVIEQMKARIAFLESQDGVRATESYGGRSLASEGLESTHVDSTTSNSNVRSHQDFMDNGADEVGYLSVAAMGEPDRQDMNAHDSPSFATFVHEATKVLPDLRSARRMISEPSDSLQDVDLLAIQEDLKSLCHCDLRFFIDAYCAGIGKNFPCISAANCYEALSTALQSDLEGAVSQEKLSPSEAAVLVCFTVSLGILNSPHCRTAQQPFQRLIATAMRLLPTVIDGLSDVEAVRFLLLASVLCLQRFEEASCWHLIGLAATKAISAGLHRTKSSQGNDDDSSALMWTLYKLDRAFAFVLDRPFSIEDGDMTIELPQATSPHSTGLPAQDQNQFFVWTVHYSHMLSGWRRQVELDVEACLSSLDYWRETCREFGASIQPVSSQVSAERDRTSTTVNVAEAQLTCRALVHIFIRSLESLPHSSPLLNRVCRCLENEVPQLITKYRAAMDTEALGPNLVDAYDVLCAITAYICSRQVFLLCQSQTQMHTGKMTLDVAGMRLVTSCMDILQKMSERFELILDAQELLWCFLSALESREHEMGRASFDARNGAANMTKLQQAISNCRLAIPRHLAFLMERAVT